MIARAKDALLIALLSMGLCVGFKVCRLLDSATTTVGTLNKTVAHFDDTAQKAQPDALAMLHAVRQISEQGASIGQSVDGIMADAKMAADKAVAPKTTGQKVASWMGVFAKIAAKVIL